MRSQGVEITLRDRGKIGIDHRCRSALELTELWRNFAGERDWCLRIDLLTKFSHLLFVSRVAKREKQANSDRLYTLRFQLLHRLHHRLIVQWTYYLATCADAFGDLQSQVARDQRFWKVNGHIIKPCVRTLDAGDLQHIAESFGSYQTYLGSLALDQRVGAYRRTVGEVGYILHGHTRLVEYFFNTREYPLGEVSWCGQGLGVVDLTRFIIN